jgi:endonuclease YncB( thermonuclease family)
LKSLLLLLTLTTLLFGVSLKDRDYGTAIVSEVTSVYDGDTFRVNLAGYPPIVGERIGIRVNGIDTPEIRGECEAEKTLARQAKEMTVTALRGAKTIELRHMKRGKYFRIVADVYVDGNSLGDALVDAGLAVPYDGGTKTKEWCRGR